MEKSIVTGPMCTGGNCWKLDLLRIRRLPVRDLQEAGIPEVMHDVDIAARRMVLSEAERRQQDRRRDHRTECAYEARHFASTEGPARRATTDSTISIATSSAAAVEQARFERPAKQRKHDERHQSKQ